MEPVTITTPDRTNWKLFCQEPRLTQQEYDTWYEMAKQISNGDESLFDFIADATAEEYHAAKEAETLDGWEGLAVSADARRRLKRAEIGAYKKKGE